MLIILKYIYSTQHIFQEHSKFVQSVRYAPSGDLFASGGFDGKVCIFDGKDCEFVKELGSPAHKGGVYGVSWKEVNTSSNILYYCALYLT